jgi:2'-5' RNA ligase
MPTPPVPQTALIVPVPEAEACVGAWRARFDPSAALGVPAHITVLHPFMGPGAIDAAMRNRIGAIAAAHAPFAFRLGAIGRFPGTLDLAPDPARPVVALTQALAAAFADWPPYGGRHAGVVPHLTVAQVDAAWLDAIEPELRTSLDAHPIAAHCTEIVLIENASGRWRPMHAFALSRGAPESSAARRFDNTVVRRPNHGRRR